MEFVDQIKPNDESINIYLQKLKDNQYQIPTFQRDLVWEKDDVKKFWDSVYRFYPVGSILVWKTDTELKKHREIGGHELDLADINSNFNYILDGQQRTTALLTSIHGVKEDAWDAAYQPPLYIDLKVEEAEDVEDSNYKERFLFEDEVIGERRNIPNRIRQRHKEGYIVRLRDIMMRYDEVERRIHDKGHTDYDDPIRERLRRIHRVLQSYQIPLIELREIGVDEVTEIFERVNQQGEPLSIFDIVVAKTFRPADSPEGGFYLRELIDDFRKQTDGEFAQIGDLTYLQMLAMIIRYHVDDNNVQNITDTYLPNIKTEQIEEVWAESTRAFRKTFDFFENHLNLKGPDLIPYRYFYITISFYFYDNRDPDYNLLKRYFWYYSFHTNDDLFSNTYDLRNHLSMLYDAKQGQTIELDPFVLDRDDLRTASYSYRGRYSRAILCLLSYHDPKDWKHPDRSVISDVYYMLVDEPNLHHIFPVNFLDTYPGNDKYDADTMMNIAFIPQLTNIGIGDDDPIKYFREFDSDEFENVLDTHLIPKEILKWSRENETSHRLLDEFVDKRVELFEATISNILKSPEKESQLGEIEFNVMDSRIYQGENIQLLIEEGENQTLEFKSTFRTSIRNEEIPKRVIEFQCLKTINGFLNSPSGGKLLIGVKDNGEIQGLEEDYETFNHDEKRDYFQQTLLNRIGSSMESRFKDFVRISFVTINNKDVCIVDVENAPRPAFIEHEGEEQFFVRRGNLTEPVKGRDRTEYITENFDDY